MATSGSRRVPSEGVAGSPTAVLAEAWSTVRLADALAGTSHAERACVDDGLDMCRAALDDVHRTLVARLVDASAAADRERLGEMVLATGHARESLCSRRADDGGWSALAGMMERLRTAATTATVLERAPREVADLGYERCMVSRVRHGQWIAESSYVRDDLDLARAMTLAGRESPVRLGRELVESELVRRRAPMLVRDAQRHPRTHRRLIDLTGTTEYAAAPIQVGRAVVGFVHVDRNHLTGSVDEGDLEVLALVSQCLGYALERAIQQERLEALRASIVSQTSSLLGLFDEVDPVLDDIGPAPGPSVTLRAVAGGATPAVGIVEGAPHRAPGRGLAGDLTARELEVLERVAAGEGNGDIAAGLFITEATVKAHVKHIFRKLGVANRAEAVSRYLRG